MSAGEWELATEKFSRAASLHYPSEWCKLSFPCVYIKALLRTRLFRIEQNHGGLLLVSVTSRFAQQTWINCKIGLRWKLLYGDATVASVERSIANVCVGLFTRSYFPLSFSPQFSSPMTSTSISIRYSLL